jgi:mannosyl-glycoprotein endo-beta-N-acetylglucosaminidase
MSAPPDGNSNPFTALFERTADRWGKLRKYVNEILTVEGSQVTLRSKECNKSRQNTAHDRTGFPVISPISTLDAALRWEPGLDNISTARVPLQNRIDECGNIFNSPNILIAHDMMGGYTNDRFIQGCATNEDYYFCHWHHISAFIYFSHHLISLPPPTWTNAAHRNGVLSMGTFITEWQDGAKICHRLFSDEKLVETLVHQMVSMAVYYQFDGWLVNIENPINPVHLENLFNFLALLTIGIHEAIPGSKVIWYDSVTTSGHLKWQNKLNHNNM